MDEMSLKYILSQSTVVVIIILAIWFYWYKIRPEQQRDREKYEDALKESLAKQELHSESRVSLFTETMREVTENHKEAISEIKEAFETSSQKMTIAIECLTDEMRGKKKK